MNDRSYNTLDSDEIPSKGERNMLIQKWAILHRIIRIARQFKSLIFWKLSRRSNKNNHDESKHSIPAEESLKPKSGWMNSEEGENIPKPTQNKIGDVVGIKSR